jgi:hypothetical protein
MLAKLLLGLLLCCICAASASAGVREFGSALTADATITEAHPVDSAFWPARLTGGRHVRAPATGQVFFVEMKGTIAKPDPLAPEPVRLIFFQHLRPRPNGRMRVLQTSGRFLAPVGGDPNRVTTYQPINLCVRRGDVIDFNDVGGFMPPSYPDGTPFRVFGAVPGSATTRFTRANHTNNGATLSPQHTRAGEELLMRLVMGTGSRVGSACRSFNRAH